MFLTTIYKNSVYRTFWSFNTFKYCSTSTIKKYLAIATILGIETSCDDTGCAVIDTSGTILGESLYSQHKTHLKYGGINPYIACELHRGNVDLAVKDALHNANIKIKDIDAIAVTVKPGLVMSLLVGIKYAKYLARTYQKPIIPIHHMEAHALAVRMQDDVPFPYLVLLISGGHCLLAVVKDVNDYLLLGQSMDNAPGEIMDKVARRMKLKNIPAYADLAGGKAIEEAAKNSKNPTLFQFSLPLVRKRDCNFSFSGLKDSSERKLMKKEAEHGIEGDGIIPEVNDLCAALQIAITEHLVHRIDRGIQFCEKNNLLSSVTKNIVVSGGVACNDFIFASIQAFGRKIGYNVFRPPPKLCTDNGVMIAWNGYECVRKQINLVEDISFIDAIPIAPLGKNLIKDVIDANLPARVTRLKSLKPKF